MSSATVGHIRDQDFDGLSLDELDENEFQRLARAGFPLLLPWHREPVRLGTGYHSSRQLTENPWATETPFVLAELMLQAKVFRAEQGTSSSFTSKKTSRSAETKDHLTLGFGVGLSPPIPVVAVGVKGTFDEEVQANSDGDKQSIRASTRAGCVDFETGPSLTSEAIDEIRYGGGFEGFRARYGDYYVAGYRLGADTGLLLSSSSSSRKQIDKFSIRAEVDVLFASAANEWEKDFEQFRSGRSLKLLGYDTLDGRNWKNASAAGYEERDLNNWSQERSMADEGSLRADAEAIVNRAHSLIDRVEEVLRAHDVRNGTYLTFSQCETLVAAGVVVELLLSPMERLRDVLQWRSNDNIIENDEITK